MIVRDSNSISIRVIHAMESVELEVEQDEAGVVTKLNCFSVGGYPETTNFKMGISLKNWTEGWKYEKIYPLQIF